MKYQIKDIEFNVETLYSDLKNLGVKALADIDDLAPVANRWNAENSYKLIGKELLFYLDLETLSISEANIDLIARSIFYRYGIKWNKDYEAFMTEYNPVHNYDRSESWTDTTTHTGNYSDQASGKDEKKDGAKQTTKIAAFDIDTMKPDGEVGDESEGSYTYGKKNEHIQDLKDELTHKAEIKGNIGVTTSQQMIESEFVLREKYRLLDIISNDIREALTLKVYRLSDL